MDKVFSLKKRKKRLNHPTPLEKALEMIAILQRPRLAPLTKFERQFFHADTERVAAL